MKIDNLDLSSRSKRVLKTVTQNENINFRRKPNFSVEEIISVYGSGNNTAVEIVKFINEKLGFSVYTKPPKKNRLHMSIKFTRVLKKLKDSELNIIEGCRK